MKVLFISFLYITHMYIKSLSLNNFRNFTDLSVDLGKGINFIFGSNGSGKTSFLESIYYLSLARSFRTNKNTSIINNDAKLMTIFAELYNETTRISKLGVTRQSNGQIQIRMNGENVQKVSVLAKQLCIALISPDNLALLEGGPTERREFIDWGCFYHFAEYSKLHQDFRKLLKQRNVILQQKQPQSYLQAWDDLFVSLSMQINEYRQKYIEIFNSAVNTVIQQILPNVNISLELYTGGKSTAEEFYQQLLAAYQREIILGYSLYGPHKADLKVKTGNTVVAEVLSRGQQKLLVTAMRIAQGRVFETVTKQNCIYLFDDICSELDVNNQQLVFNYMLQYLSESQVLLTALNDDILKKFSFVDSMSAPQIFYLKDNMLHID